MKKDKELHLERKVMKEIKEGKIKLRSRYIFLAKKLGLGGGFVLSIILAILFINLSFFVVKISGNLEFLSFGRIGFLAFLESFPYQWIVVSLIFFLAASAFLSRYDISYKKSFKALLGILLLLIFIAGTVLTMSGINENIENKVTKGKFSLLQHFYGERKGIWRSGIMGRIIKIQDSAFTIETPDNKQVYVQLTRDTHFLTGSDFHSGDYIRAVGKWDKDNFEASGIRHFNKGKGFMGEPVNKGKGTGSGLMRVH